MTPRSRTGDGRGVSPVIGVVMIVAITVILATIVGAFALDLGNSVRPDVRAGANVETSESDDSVEVIYTTSEDADSLEVTIDNGTTSETYELSDVGNIVEVAGDGTHRQGATVPDGTDDFAGSGLTDGDTVQVVVVAVHEEDSNVIITRQVEV